MKSKKSKTIREDDFVLVLFHTSSIKSQWQTFTNETCVCVLLYYPGARLRKQLQARTNIKSPTQFELEELEDEIGLIEGPGFDSTSSSRSSSSVSLSSAVAQASRSIQKLDDFWDA